MPGWSGWKVMAASFPLGLLLWAGCSRTEVPSTTRIAARSEPSASTLVLLAKADAADGIVDKVISKCVACSLSMKGKPEFAATCGEYTAHSCSEACRDAFINHTEEALLALKFPEEKKVDGPDSRPANP